MSEQDWRDLGNYAQELKNSGYVINWQSFIKSKSLLNLQYQRVDNLPVIFWSDAGLSCGCERLTFLVKNQELVKQALIKNGQRARKTVMAVSKEVNDDHHR